MDVLWTAPPPADARITYGPHSSQFGDLRLPPGPGLHPLLVVIHGGFRRACYNLNHAGYAAGSPAELLPLGVRQTLRHGTADADVPAGISLDYAQRALESGDPVDMVPLDGADHFALIDPRSAAWPAVAPAVGRLVHDGEADGARRSH